MMTPSLSRSSETANRVKCAMNLRRIGQAIMLYRNNNGGEFPDSLWSLILAPSSGLDAHAFICPSSNDEKPDHATV
jgi:prepilin-type processing-associated H-X9-DG protein